MKDKTSNDKEAAATPALDAAVAKKIAEHYSHAKEAHPYFVDRMYEEQDVDMARQSLKMWRTQIQDEIETGNRCAETVLNCELCEVAEAFFMDDTAHAVEECYDAIAVILRMVDVLEGRQSLGKPEKESEAKE